MISTRSFCQTPTHLLEKLFEGGVGRWENLRVSGTEVDADSAFEEVFHGDRRRFFFLVRGGERWKREMEPDQFFFFKRTQIRQHPFPPTMVMSTSAVRRTLRQDVVRFASARRFHTEPRPLKTPEDWSDFQLERASYKRLSEYATTISTASTHTLVHSRPLHRIWLNPDKGKYFPATPWSSPSPCSFTTLPLHTPGLWRPLWTF